MSSSMKNGLPSVEQADPDSLQNQSQINTQGIDLDERMNQAFAQMERDVPPMPDSFRLGWRHAVRQDQKSISNRNKSQQNMDSPVTVIQHGEEFLSEESSRNERSSNKKENRKSQLHHLLRIAALVVFLLGGAMLARPSFFASVKNIPSVQESYAKTQEFSAASEMNPESEEEIVPLEEAEPAGNAAPLATESPLYSSWASENPNSGSVTSFGRDSAAGSSVFSALPDAENNNHKIVSDSAAENTLKTGGFSVTRIIGLVLIVFSLFLFFQKRR